MAMLFSLARYSPRDSRPVRCSAWLFGGRLAGGRQQARKKSGDVPSVIRTTVMRALHLQTKALVRHVHADFLIDFRLAMENSVFTFR
jgi:hypothetical protein